MAVEVSCTTPTAPAAATTPDPKAEAVPAPMVPAATAAPIARPPVTAPATTTPTVPRPTKSPRHEKLEPPSFPEWLAAHNDEHFCPSIFWLGSQKLGKG